jgi:Protein of unknown function (DUF3263)
MNDEDRAILQLEQKWWRRPGAKHTAIAELDMNETTYARRLNELIRTPEAALEFPQVVNRLRRVQRERVAMKRGRSQVA